MKIYTKEDINNVLVFFISNIKRYFRNDGFEFCLAFIKTKNISCAASIKNALRNTDLVFATKNGIVILLSGTPYEHAYALINDFSEFVDGDNKICIVNFPLDSDNAQDLLEHLEAKFSVNHKEELF
ncbi:hypothetical protein [Campylobacter canadensis]|uniref:Uncharacterized protein n=1 Tax=Campylobacter canadensis TaxID=449520 RepID=A0ABS7WS75_9BACT|nr:hypothetical protein [Campylobacter canadensis]MBZ7987231.1 hypothetical protein [Campylobacter canadensis]MBZ7996005.1 hypothetical protein [Campylobacter canadensis]MBZ7998340.1 hypothetical protein [Campylobacter canadensis]MBZ7999641.1 hypothetical protein [Campylobacter canadensis]MBZ8001436.1 hypothetical protein [Campylobacter canadensis]